MKRTFALLSVFAATGVPAAQLQIVTENNPPFNFQEGKDVMGTSTAKVREMLSKAGVDATFYVLKWDDAYARAQKNANTCIYSTVRVDNREKLFKWYGPIGTNAWALYALPTFDKTLASLEDARFYKIGAVKHDAKVDFLRGAGASSIREADRDSENPGRLAKPRTDPNAIDLWITTQATARETAAKAGVRDLKEVLVVKKQELFLACNPRTDKDILGKLDAAAGK
jgi:polar amino acid transport system substrate-binding protein